MSRLLDDIARKMAPAIIEAVAADPIAFARRAAVRALLTWAVVALQLAALALTMAAR